MKLLLAESAIQVDNAPSNDNVTPLYSACFNGHLEVVRYLLRDGRADVKYVTNPNETGTDPLYPLRHSFVFRFGCLEYNGLVCYAIPGGREGRRDLSPASVLSQWVAPLLYPTSG